MHPYLNQFEAVIFDMDGTLIDTMPAHMIGWQKTGEVHGFPYDADWHYSLGGVPTLGTAKLIVERYKLDLDPQLLAKTKKDLWEKLKTEPVVFAETFAVFKDLLGQKPVAVGTGSEKNHAIEVLGETGILENLNALVTADDVENGKPHPETFLKAAQQMGVNPANCVVFEDTQIGRQAALDAGMQCILVVDGKIQW